VRHDAEAMRALGSIAVPEERKDPLRRLAAALLERSH
jgi:hypothetical protein